MLLRELAVGELTYLEFCLQTLSLDLPRLTLDPMHSDPDIKLIVKHLCEEQVADPY